MMKKISVYMTVIFGFLVAGGCEDGGLTNTAGPSNNSGSNSNTTDWLIPKDKVFDGGPGKDGIPALTTPDFVPVPEIDYLLDNDLVLAFKNGEEVKIYPHPVLDWHEIINDQAGDISIAVTYCPLTGTGIGWDREIDGKLTTFGVSGLLYNSNLIPYDRATNSNWSQMRLDCVNGVHKGKTVETFTLFETTWGTIKGMYGNAKVVSKETGHSRPYGEYPYGSYKEDNSYLIFPVSNSDNRLSAKQRVHGVIIGEKVKAYRLAEFKGALSLLTDTVGKNEIIVAGSQPDNFIVSFYTETSDSEFKVEKDSYPVILSDSEGNKWDVFGHAVEGPRKGERLKSPRSFMGYWFAWAAFYPDIEIYGL